MGSVAGAFASHLLLIYSGAAGFAIVAHAVNTFPMPKSTIGRWFLGVIQFAVGQRLQGLATMNGVGAAQAARDTAEGK